MFTDVLHEINVLTSLQDRADHGGRWQKGYEEEVHGGQRALGSLAKLLQNIRSLGGLHGFSDLRVENGFVFVGALYFEYLSVQHASEGRRILCSSDLSFV